MGERVIQITEKFLEAEDKHGLFELKVKDINIWEYLRMNYYYMLLDYLTGSRTKHAEISTKVEYSQEWFAKHQFLLRKKPLLVLNASRRVYEQGKFRAYVLDDFLNDLKESYYIFEDEYVLKHIGVVKAQNLRSRNIKSVGAYFGNNTLYQAEALTVENIINKAFEEEFSVTYSLAFRKSLRKLFKSILWDAYCGRRYAEAILKLVCPKMLVVTVYYNGAHQAFIEQAKKRSIPVIEIQHGSVGRYLPAYNFKRKRELATFPDYFFAYGKYEKKTVRFPIAEENVYLTGCPELEKQSEYWKNRKIPKSGKIITFISNPISGHICAKYAVELAEKLEGTGISILYKLHPKEYVNWEKTFPDLAESNVEVISDNCHDVYYYLGQSDYVVGITSTALIEATMFNANVVVIQEADYKRTPLTSEQALFVKSVTELQNVIQNGGAVEKKELSVFYEEDSITKMKTALKDSVAKYDKMKKPKMPKESLFKRLRLMLGLSMAEHKARKKVPAATMAKGEEHFKKQSQKHLELYLMMNQWVNIKQEGRSIAEYLVEKGYRSVAVYGMNYAGKTLCRELNNTGISVEYGIDKDAGNIIMDMDVFYPENELKLVDGIIVTAVFHFEEIKKELQEVVKCPILSLKEIIDSIAKGERICPE